MAEGAAPGAGRQVARDHSLNNCRGRESNPHALRHRILSPAWLPVTPPRPYDAATHQGSPSCCWQVIANNRGRQVFRRSSCANAPGARDTRLLNTTLMHIAEEFCTIMGTDARLI